MRKFFIWGWKVHQVALVFTTCKNITLQFGRLIVMALLRWRKWSRISLNILNTKSFVPKCNIMWFGFFFKIGKMYWLTFTKIAPLKSCTFTRRFLQNLFSSIPVIIVSPIEGLSIWRYLWPSMALFTIKWTKMLLKSAVYQINSFLCSLRPR